MIGWFRKWWPWGRHAPGSMASVEASMVAHLDELIVEYRRAIKAKKKRSHIEARMKEIRTELLRMEAGK